MFYIFILPLSTHLNLQFKVNLCQIFRAYLFENDIHTNRKILFAFLCFYDFCYNLYFKCVKKGIFRSFKYINPSKYVTFMYDIIIKTYIHTVVL